MSEKIILIDQSYGTETRVAIIKDSVLQEFDYEIDHKKSKKGNVYLAKIARIEPSLQAAFIDYGEDKNGFLPFSHIHPDYYQIPIEDREKAVLAKEFEEAQEYEEIILGKEEETTLEGEDKKDEEDVLEEIEIKDEEDVLEEIEIKDEEDVLEEIEIKDEEDVLEEIEIKTKKIPARYKIQEVLKRHQVILVQVIKDSRGQKGLAFTTYISLPGRYSVLMPNTTKGKGISRKISNSETREKLHKIIESLALPEKMGMIVRTAGLGKTKIDIRKDVNYLMRLWDDIREKVVNSQAPALIYEERDLITRTLRDSYEADIQQILVQGAKGYKKAREFMRMLAPSNLKRVQQYEAKKSSSLFDHYDIEKQIRIIYRPTVDLPSGGSIVINPTEALVSIDVNSARATKLRNFGSTALKTNLEAAKEIARQLRMRSLSGLIVIDFIDMENAKHNAQVEIQLKNALKEDRAYTKVGKIGQFALLQMSRQRTKQSLMEKGFVCCPYCEGVGKAPSLAFTSFRILGALEKKGANAKKKDLIVYATPLSVDHIVNSFRRELIELENRYGISITIKSDVALFSGYFFIEEIQVNEDTLKKITSIDQEDKIKTKNELENDVSKENVEEESAGELDPKKKAGKRRKRRLNKKEKNLVKESEEEKEFHVKKDSLITLPKNLDHLHLSEIEAPEKSPTKNMPQENSESDVKEVSLEKPKKFRRRRLYKRKTVKKEDSKENGKEKEDAD